jgi:nitroimidazol reductase NimA-like FMN-containing flavoprotein (pyridoxamine 5'-phosphate oxidase superfamily)
MRHRPSDFISGRDPTALTTAAGSAAADGKDAVMDQHDVDTELASARELLDSTSVGHLAYTAKDGTPRVIPVGFYWTGEQFVISTASTAPKVAALSARPDVALAIDAGGTPEQARALSVRGRADIRIVDGVVEEYLAAARKSMDAEAAAQFEQNCRQMYDRMARIAITPRWVRYYDFGAGRMPKFLQELAERSGR